MNGWISLALIAGLTAFAFACARAGRLLWGGVIAALSLGTGGYALQQHASWPSRLARPDRNSVVIDPTTIALRGAMLGQFTGDGAYLIASDALMRGGNRPSGARVVAMGLNAYPRSLTLWTGYGTAIAQHDGTVSPAAVFAFDQATRLAPAHPAPPYFRGLAYAESGDFGAARRYWLLALALTPPEAPYRSIIADQIATLDAVAPQ
ncbi:tetratricopeptide repeat protein [Sphingomonas sp. MMS24-J45]|uniref:tetratricopeptide repeat protein n=1 Tax=Sphingomonas sp. MMS24-J45 TaxID=3238806 RepID=UPI003850BA84